MKLTEKQIKVLEDLSIQDIIKLAKENGTCIDAIQVMEDCKSVLELFENTSESTMLEWISWYLCHVIGKYGRNKKVEPFFNENPQLAFIYTFYVVGERWPEVETMIAAYPYWAYHYAYEIIKGRWPEGEKIILTDPEYSFYYAKYVIRDRWIEAEPVIMTAPKWAEKYENEL